MNKYTRAGRSVGKDPKLSLHTIGGFVVLRFGGIDVRLHPHQAVEVARGLRKIAEDAAIAGASAEAKLRVVPPNDAA